MTGEDVQQHYARQEEWQRLFASRARQWAISSGRVPSDASREVIDRAVSEALHERGVSRGASPSSVKKWRTGRFAPPPLDLLAVLEQMLGTGSELADLLATITPDLPADDPDPAEASGDDGGSDDDDRSPAGVAPGAPRADADAGGAAPRRHRRALLGAAVVVVAVLVIGAVLLNRRSPGRVESGRKGGDGSCRVEVGDLPDGLESGAGATQREEAFIDAYRDAGGRTGAGCPVAPVERWEELLVQTLPGPVDGSPAALVVVADEPDLHFSFPAALWTSYRELRENSGGQPEVGVPTAVSAQPDGHVEVQLDNGMLLVAERADAPYFYIPIRYVKWWRDNKDRAGLPMGNPRPGEGRQDTENGYASVARNAPEPVLHLDPDPEAGLPAEVDQGEVIITEADGTDWWVTAAGDRQWIADVGTWTCLGGISKTVGDNRVPGAAVATLDYDGIATCED